MPGRIKRISKSQYIKGLQCPKALWLFWHRKDLRPEVDERKQHVFDVGNEVGRLATEFFDGGVEITEAYNQIDKAIDSTQKAVKGGAKYIYEATACSDDGAYSRIDIFEKVHESDVWNLIEVKSSTSVKDYHLDDITLQRYAFIHAGYHIHKSILMHLDRTYVRSGPIYVKALFKLEDCTEIAEMKIGKVQAHLNQLITTINESREPSAEIGSRCKTPFECDYINYCWQNIPEYSVYNIFFGKKLNALHEKNIIDVLDVPDTFETTDRQFIEVDAYKNKKIYKDIKEIKSFLNTLIYPLYFLDYETISPAIPLFDNTSPYQTIPFQFSLHIQEKKGGEMKHVEFLHTGDDDPRSYLTKALVENCGTKGSVVVYNQPFEEEVNRGLGYAFPEYKKKLESINERMVDLLIPFSKRYLYHPEMKGSASLKNVLPALVPDLAYDGLAIDDGMTASLQYLKCMQGTASNPEKETIFKHLKEYCALDTLAEVRLLEVLHKAI
ncbi:MAG: DUF2779 domain-containing protein [Deltaproteobacteria bacterium]|nr:DUF2779 domain-containing protein [Deltaproteobacteria bacterium]